MGASGVVPGGCVRGGARWVCKGWCQVGVPEVVPGGCVRGGGRWVVLGGYMNMCACWEVQYLLLARHHLSLAIIPSQPDSLEAGPLRGGLPTLCGARGCDGGLY